MRNAKMLQIMKGMEDKYPAELERKFPRILNKIAELWEMPEARIYFEELMVDRRGNRKGFPPKVAEEIFFLSNLHNKLRESGERPSDVWVLEHARNEPLKPTSETLEKRFFKSLVAGDERALSLLNAGVNVDTRGEGGWTPLIVALFNRHEQLALALLEHNANVRAADDGGYTALHWAASHGFPKITKALIERDADVNAQNKWLGTPLMLAAEHGHAEIVRLLLIAGADVKAADRDGVSALHRAAGQDRLTLIELLLDRGADVNARGRKGTALHEAASAGHARVVELLLRRGAKVNVRDGDGETPLAMAQRRGHKTIADLLRFKGGGGKGEG